MYLVEEELYRVNILKIRHKALLLGVTVLCKVLYTHTILKIEKHQ
jgi:hypothetical protein